MTVSLITPERVSRHFSPYWRVRFGIARDVGILETVETDGPQKTVEKRIWASLFAYWAMTRTHGPDWTR